MILCQFYSPRENTGKKEYLADHRHSLPGHVPQDLSGNWLEAQKWCHLCFMYLSLLHRETFIFLMPNLANVQSRISLQREANQKHQMKVSIHQNWNIHTSVRSQKEFWYWSNIRRNYTLCQIFTNSLIISYCLLACNFVNGTRNIHYGTVSS